MLQTPLTDIDNAISGDLETVVKENDPETESIKIFRSQTEKPKKLETLDLRSADRNQLITCIKSQKDKIRSLENALSTSHLGKELSVKNGEITKLTQVLTEKENEMKLLQNRYNDLERDKKSLEAAKTIIQSKLQEFQQTTTELNKIKVQYESKTKELEEVKSKLSELQTSNQNFQKFNFLEKNVEYENQKNEIMTLKNTIKDMEKEISEKNLQLQVYKGQLEVAKQNCSQLQQNIKDREKEEEKYKSLYIKSQEELQKSRDEFDLLQIKFNQQQVENSKSTSNQESEAQIKEYQNTIAALEKSLVQEKEHWSLEIAVLKQCYENPTSTDIVKQIQNLKEDLNSVNQENTQLKEKEKVLQEQLQQHQIELNQSTEAKNLIHKQLTEKNKSLETVKKDHDQLKTLNAKLSEQVVALEARKNLFLILSLILSIVTALLPIFNKVF